MEGDQANISFSDVSNPLLQKFNKEDSMGKAFAAGVNMLKVLIEKRGDSQEFENAAQFYSSTVRCSKRRDERRIVYDPERASAYEFCDLLGTAAQRLLADSQITQDQGELTHSQPTHAFNITDAALTASNPLLEKFNKEDPMGKSFAAGGKLMKALIETGRSSQDFIDAAHDFSSVVRRNKQRDEQRIAYDPARASAYQFCDLLSKAAQRLVAESNITHNQREPPSSNAVASFANAPGSSTGTRTNEVRSNLLAEIQAGHKLKKVALEEAAAEKESEGNVDVAAILIRRFQQVHGRESESDDDDSWDD